MRRAFADAHFYLALLSRRDQHHRAATKIAGRGLFQEIITTAWVLTEVADAMSRPRDRERCARFVANLRQQPRVRIVEAEEALYWRGFAHYAKYRDKEWSLTDCISFVVMAEEALEEALTADHHFEQAGFTALLLAED